MLSPEERYWRHRAARLVVGLRACWALEKAFPWLVALNVGAMAAVLLLRVADTSASWLYWPYGLTIALAAAYGWWAARPRFPSFEQALARLDDAYGLSGSLMAAAGGRAAWPPEAAAPGKAFRLAWPVLVGRWTLSAAALAAAILWPTAQRSEYPSETAGRPPRALEMAAELVAALELSELVDEGAMQQLEDRLGALQATGPQGWYSDAGREASEFLRSETERAAQAFLQALQTASLNALRVGAAGSGSPFEEGASRHLRESLTQLDRGSLPLRADLMQALRDLAREGNSGMDAESLQRLVDRLEQGANTCRSGMGLPPLKLEEIEYALRPGGGMDGEDPDEGGPAPLTLAATGSPGIDGSPAGLSNPDRERAILGDTAFTSTYQSEDYQPGYGGLETSARSEHLGQGGEAVWSIRVRPNEQAVLRNYFSQ